MGVHIKAAYFEKRGIIKIEYFFTAIRLIVPRQLVHVCLGKFDHLKD